MELKAAKEILSEVFHACPADVEEMIQRRLEDRNGMRNARKDCGQQNSVLGSSYGRSFESVRMGVKDVSARWTKASKALKKEDQIYSQKVAEMAN